MGEERGEDVLARFDQRYNPKPGCPHCGGKGYNDRGHYYTGCHCIFFAHSISDEIPDIINACRPPGLKALIIGPDRDRFREETSKRIAERYLEIGANDKNENVYHKEDVTNGTTDKRDDV